MMAARDKGKIMTQAQKAVEFSYSIREDGLYCRPRDKELVELGGYIVASSNDGASSISFSPTETWAFEDGSRAEFAYSDATVL